MSNVQRAVDTVRELMERKAPLDDDPYWGNLFMLVFLTWAVLLYIFLPGATEITVQFDTVLIFLIISGYSLILFNQVEILRKRVDALSE